jgi:hypothetical protein
MATATMARAGSGRAVSGLRVKAKLVLMIGEEVFFVRPFEDENERLSLCEWKHTLIGPDGREFHVYEIMNWNMDELPRDKRLMCTGCGRQGCQHARAIEAVGLR